MLTLYYSRAINLGQLGTPPDSARYSVRLTGDAGAPLSGEDSYTLTVPVGIVYDEGYHSITLCGTEDKALMSNPQKRNDRTTFSSLPNAASTYTLELNPSGAGSNGIPTGEAYYTVLRA
jgi:hypothetical protein